MNAYLLTAPTLLVAVVSVVAFVDSDVAAQPTAMTAYAPESASKVPEVYLYYHGLVTPHGPLASARNSRVVCTAFKGGRT